MDKWPKEPCRTISTGEKRDVPTLSINGGLLYKPQFLYTMKYYVTLTKKRRTLAIQRYAKIVGKRAAKL